MSNEMMTLFEGYPLYTCAVDEEDELACLAKDGTRIPVYFSDPDKYVLDGEAKMAGSEAMRFQAIVTQQLRKRLESGGVGARVLHLIYKKRKDKLPLVAIMVANTELTFERTKKIDARDASITQLRPKL